MDVFDVGEGAVFGAVFDDVLGAGGADTGKSLEFCGGGGVEVDGEGDGGGGSGLAGGDVAYGGGGRLVGNEDFVAVVEGAGEVDVLGEGFCFETACGEYGVFCAAAGGEVVNIGFEYGSADVDDHWGGRGWGAEGDGFAAWGGIEQEQEACAEYAAENADWECPVFIH